MGLSTDVKALYRKCLNKVWRDFMNNVDMTSQYHECGFTKTLGLSSYLNISQNL